MKLNSVAIKNFKSIEGLTIDKCGKFNVFIGQNNSGKSNILSAINYFFQCIKNKEFLNLQPPIGEEIDFFNRNSQKTIEICLSFLLSTENKEQLISDIISEAPQMKNAVNGLESMT
ncbi:MAG: AAA family ATPase [Crocosphaera sp.]|nr:AAA family ATPase [Crocosphaera sp.]